MNYILKPSSELAVLFILTTIVYLLTEGVPSDKIERYQDSVFGRGSVNFLARWKRFSWVKKKKNLNQSSNFMHL